MNYSSDLEPFILVFKTALNKFPADSTYINSQVCPDSFLEILHLVFYQEAKLITSLIPIAKADISLLVCIASANGILQSLTLPGLFPLLG